MPHKISPTSLPGLIGLPGLTGKQREVLALVADNRTSKEIAAQLGISESAVNQRIENIRARLGGLPRGQLARLYRRESTPSPAEIAECPGEPAGFGTDWQKIYLSSTPDADKIGPAESIPFALPDGSQPSRAADRNGSQLSAPGNGFAIGPDIGHRVFRLSREDHSMVFARAAFIILILIVGILLGAGITAWVAPAIASD